MAHLAAIVKAQLWLSRLNLYMCVFMSVPTAQDHEQLLLSLNRQLLHSVEDKDSLPNPSVHLALRLSTTHNLKKEADYLNHLKTEFHNDIERWLVMMLKISFQSVKKT